MAKNESKRLTPTILGTDAASHAALQAIEGYAPANPAFTLTAINAARAELTEAQAAEAQAQAAAAAARDTAVAKEWAFHKLILGAKDQVIAQFGQDSDEVQALGLKRKSEYKSPGRRTGTKTSGS